MNRELWEAAYASVHQADAPADALTSTEFAAMLGVGVTQAKFRLRELIRAGKVRRFKKRITRTDGVTGWAPAYQLVDTAPPAKKKGQKKR